MKVSRVNKGLGFLLLTGIFLSVIGLILPSKYYVKREVLIQANQSKIFPSINTINRWPEWTIVNKNYDGSLKEAFDGPEKGVGASLIYIGRKLGNGVIRITDSEVNQGVKFSLKMNNEKSESFGSVILTPDAGGTKVSVVIEGDVGYHLVNRYVIIFMDYFMGPLIEESLSGLKTTIEADR